MSFSHGRTCNGLTLKNADIGGKIRTMRVVGPRIVSLDGAAQPADCVVDLRGDRILPGMINAHDHLQLNGFPRPKFRERYTNVSEWIDDVSCHTRADPLLAGHAKIAREERLLQGGIKNLLSGVTSVAHHDRLYESLCGPDYPVNVVSRYGWSHSLAIDGKVKVRESYHRTPADEPWIIHAAEGVDEKASEEFETLQALGCIGNNSLIVHGIALNESQRRRLAAAGGGLIWCPSSNLHLFGKTAVVADLIRQGRVALGSDSRLSGGRDLLEEIAIAREIGGFDEVTLEFLVTQAGARLLHLADRGALLPQFFADMVILPRDMPLSLATRSDLRGVLVEGTFRYGDRYYAQLFDTTQNWMDINVDGRMKVLQEKTAKQLWTAAAREPGVARSDDSVRAA